MCGGILGLVFPTSDMLKGRCPLGLQKDMGTTYSRFQVLTTCQGASLPALPSGPKLGFFGGIQRVPQTG